MSPATNRQINEGLAIAAFELWLSDLTDGELADLLEGQDYHMNLSRWVKVIQS